MKNIMIILGTFLFGTASCASNSAMEIFKSFDEYQITKVEESRVCWATLSATSSNGVPSFFATYKRKDGDLLKSLWRAFWSAHDKVLIRSQLGFHETWELMRFF